MKYTKTNFCYNEEFDRFFEYLLNDKFKNGIKWFGTEHVFKLGIGLYIDYENDDWFSLCIYPSDIKNALMNIKTPKHIIELHNELLSDRMDYEITEDFFASLYNRLDVKFKTYDIELYISDEYKIPDDILEQFAFKSSSIGRCIKQ